MYDLLIRNGTVVDGTGQPAFSADVAVRGGQIAEVGTGLGRARREIDAEGKLVTPGFVDVHTHYDGQATWDTSLSSSLCHGVTTAVMGNCGVGFAPARSTERDFLIEVMEGVEEIPGAALNEGMSWDWETFPEYLDSLGRAKRSFDIATQVPHCALRCFVMGRDRAMEDTASSEDIAEMTRLTKEALKAGALGFSTSRTMVHRTSRGELVPGTYCQPEELLEISRALGEVGYGVFQMVSDLIGREPDFSWMKRIAATTGGPLIFNFVEVDDRHDPWEYRDTLARLQAVQRDENLDIRASVPWRPPGILQGLQATLNPFIKHPTFRVLKGKTLEEMLSIMQEPAIRERLLSESLHTSNTFLQRILKDWNNMYVLGDPPNYEPGPEQSIGAIARAAGVSAEAYAYDVLMQNDGRQLIYSPLASYDTGDLDMIFDMLKHPRSTVSLSDAGAHVGTVCDSSVTTFMLTHWVRDRDRGGRLPLEEVVCKQTQETAMLYGLKDRGTIAPGKKADLNVIDFEGLHLHPPTMVFDLPKGGKRLLQSADGYDFTLVSGEVVAEKGEVTDARPGRLLRGPQANG